MPSLHDLDVRRLDVAVNDPVLVRRFERLGDLLRKGQGFVERNWSARDPLRQVIALDEFHHERESAAALFEPVNRRNVRRFEGGQSFRFALKAREPISVPRQRRGRILIAISRFSFLSVAR